MKQSLQRSTQIAMACTLALGTALTALPAMAQSQSEHLRGQITAVSDSGFTITTKSGEKRQVAVGSKTGFAAVTKGDLSNIKKGTFIGTANVERDGQNKALEMVIFPPSMKGTGLGDYGWDLTPAMAGKSTSGSQTAQSNDGMSSGSSMTNGTVTSKSSGSMSSGSSMTNGSVTSKSSNDMTSGGSSMTNGTVTQQANGNGQTMTLKVDYGKGSKTIVVPTDVPTVKVQPGSKSDLKTGAHVFVVGSGSGKNFSADKVIVGRNGVVPPM